MTRLLLPTLLLLAALSCHSCATMRAVFDPPSDALSPREHLDLGLAYEQEGRLDNAARQFERAVPEIPAGWVYLGNVRFAQERYEDALEAYEQAVEALPESAEAHNNLAWTLYTLDRDLDEAEKHARRAVALAGEANRSAYADTLDRIVAARAANP